MNGQNKGLDKVGCLFTSKNDRSVRVAYGWVRCKMLGTGATIAAADSTARHTSWARWLYPTKRTRFLVKMAW